MSLKLDLYTHQIEGVQWMINREMSEDIKGGINADDVGLGKTLMSIALIIKKPLPNTLLIVPKSLIPQWISEISKFSDGLIIDIPENDKYTFNTDTNKTSITIISSSRMNMLGKENWTVYEHSSWDRLIIDEAHCIKNKKSKLHKNCSRIPTNIRWLLTATPVMNKMPDFVHMMGFIGVSQNDCQISRNEITKKYIIHRKNESDSLPDLCIEELKVPMTYENDLYTEVCSNVKSYLTRSRQQNMMQVLELLLRLRQISIHPQLYYNGMSKKYTDEPLVVWDESVSKLEAFKGLLSFENKTLVFCHFIAEIDNYSDAAIELGFKCVKLDGRMTQEERVQSVQNFHQEDIHILFVQINVGGTGFNLQVANKIIFTSPDWTPALEHQAIGRAYRNGQTRNVSVTKLICIVEGSTSIEEQMTDLKKEKEAMIKRIMNDAHGNKETRVKDVSCITISDVKRMFKKK